jgi:hypothetical protein
MRDPRPPLCLRCRPGYTRPGAAQTPNPVVPRALVCDPSTASHGGNVAEQGRIRYLA